MLTGLVKVLMSLAYKFRTKPAADCRNLHKFLQRSWIDCVQIVHVQS